MAVLSLQMFPRLSCFYFQSRQLLINLTGNSLKSFTINNDSVNVIVRQQCEKGLGANSA